MVDQCDLANGIILINQENRKMYRKASFQCQRQRSCSYRTLIQAQKVYVSGKIIKIKLPMDRKIIKTAQRAESASCHHSVHFLLNRLKNKQRNTASAYQKASANIFELKISSERAEDQIHNLQNIQVNLQMKKIETEQERKPEQQSPNVLLRPYTSFGLKKSEPEKENKQNYPTIPYDNQSSGNQHKKKLFQCKIIKCSKIPFPITKESAKRDNTALLRNLIRQTDRISEIRPNCSSEAESPQSQFFIDF